MVRIICALPQFGHIVNFVSTLGFGGGIIISFKRQYIKMPYKIKAAGGVVVQGKSILFIKKNGRWELPKGKLKKSANRKKTAIREVCEETGLKKRDLEPIQILIPTYHHIKVKKKLVLKETLWFLMHYKGTFYHHD